MKVPLKWLKEYVDIALPPAELARRITLAGFETLAIPTAEGKWENVIVGQIVAVNPHPDADRLRLPTVDLGTEKMTVVCGAPNLRVGDKVAFARVGAQLVDGHTGQLFRLKEAKIRGVVSRGMVCSEKELGISDNHREILVLPPDAPVGVPLAEYLGDVIFDFEITPNRTDCLSVIGIAREVTALTGKSVSVPEVSYEEKDSPIEQYVLVEILDSDLCSRYCATLITGAKIAESPKWMQERLQACGMRPINNVVDVTNYVMLEYGQPLHAFDYEKIMRKKIIVRRAKEGETLISLDGVSRRLFQDMLVIADAERAVAIAGIMGGANSEVSEETTAILLEAANFNPRSVHYTGRRLSLPSEARMRFERGIRPEMTIPAIKRATQLIIQLAGGKAARGIADVYPGKKKPAPILLSIEKVKRTLGITFSLDQIVATLTSLGFDCQPVSASEVLVTPPYWRGDIQQAIDLVEEVARIIGYDKIPPTMLSDPIPRYDPDPLITLKQRLRNILVGYGFQEVITYSLTSLEMLGKLRPETRPMESVPMRLLNPMTADMEYLRPTLRANLLSVLATNRRHEEDEIRLFELGKIYAPRPRDLPEEPELLCGLISGTGLEKTWLGTSRLLDFFDAKGVVEGLLKQLGIEASFVASDDISLHPTKQAAIIIGGNKVGVVGEIHPKVLAGFELTDTVYLFELSVNALRDAVPARKTFQPVPRFPAIVRDLALIVDETVTHHQVLDIIRSFPLVTEATIFDVYSGKPVPPGKKSLAYRLIYQSPRHTLTDEEVNEIQQQILDKLAKQLGATLRTM